MRIMIMGAGGVGGYFGAKLAKSGCDVNFVARAACAWKASSATSIFRKYARAMPPLRLAHPIIFS